MTKRCQFLAGFLPALLVAVAVTPVDAQNLVPFEPKPETITLQKTEPSPLGNAVVDVHLSGEEIGRLGSETGRTDFFVLGAGNAVTVLRDDGMAPDRHAADGTFSAWLQVDDLQLEERAERDQILMAQGGNHTFVFENRALVGTQPVTPFDFAAFSQGLTVPLTPPPASLASPTPGGTNAFQDNVLMITHPGVINDPGRTIDPCSPSGTLPLPAWSFGRLMTDIANPSLTSINPSVFVEDWLDHWLVPQMINSFNVPARTAMQNLIDDWRVASGGGLLDLTIAPFKLIAIAPRVDLRETTTGGGGYGGGASGTNFLNAGEGRFIFAVVDPFNGGCQERPWTVILEYGVPLNSCNAVKQWAQDWSALDTMLPGSAIYNSALQALTDVFAAPGADSSKPNHSAINQIRTNENALNPLWELREFRLVDPTPSMLSQTTVADTPDISFNNTSTVNAILGGASMAPLLGGAADVPTPSFFWDGNPSAPGVPRHEFSLGTCNGCHGGESDTFFVHVNPAPTLLSFVPMLSDFLTGTDVIDPTPPPITSFPPPNTVDPVDGTQRFFDDLDRRETDINNVASMVCSSLVGVHVPHVLSALQFHGVLPEDLFLENTLQNASIDQSPDILSSQTLTEIKDVH